MTGPTVSPTSTSSSVTSPAYSPTSVYSSPTAVSSTSSPVYVNPAERFNTSPSAPLVKPQSTASQVSQTLNANSGEPFLKISTPSGLAIYAEYGKVVSSTQFSSDLAAANATTAVNYIPATGAVRSVQNTLYNQGATVGQQYSTSPQEYAAELSFQRSADLANQVPTNRGAILSLQNTLYNQGAIIGPQYSTTPNQLTALQKQQTPSSGISISGPGGSVLNDIVNAVGYGGFFLSLAPREAYSLLTTGKSTYIPLPSQSEVSAAGTFGLLSGAAVGVGFVAAPLEAAVIPALGLSGSGATLAGLGIQAGLGAGYGGISSFVTGGNPVTGAALGALIFPASGLGLKGVGLALPVLKGAAAGSDLYQSLFRSVDFSPLTEAGGRVSSAVSGYVSSSDVLQSLFRSPDVSTASRDAYAIRYAVTSIPRQVSGAVASSDFLQSILRTPDTSVAREGISGIGASVKGAASGSDFLQSLVRSPDVPTSASVKLSASQYYYQNLLGRSAPLGSLSEEDSIDFAVSSGSKVVPTEDILPVRQGITQDIARESGNPSSALERVLGLQAQQEPFFPQYAESEAARIENIYNPDQITSKVPGEYRFVKDLQEPLGPEIIAKGSTPELAGPDSGVDSSPGAGVSARDIATFSDMQKEAAELVTEEESESRLDLLGQLETQADYTNEESQTRLGALENASSAGQKTELDIQEEVSTSSKIRGDDALDFARQQAAQPSLLRSIKYRNRIYDDISYSRTPPGYLFPSTAQTSSISGLRGLGLLGSLGSRTEGLTSYSLMQSQNQISSLSLASILQNLSVTAQSQSIVQSSIQAQIQSQSLIQLQAQSTVTETITETTLLTQLDFRFPDVLSPVYPPLVSLDSLRKRQKKVRGRKGYRPTHERNRVAMEIGSSFGDFAAALEQSDIFGSTGYFSAPRRKRAR